MDADTHILQHIFSFLELSDVHAMRPVSKSFEKASNHDVRWLPVLSPPSPDLEPAFREMNLEDHGRELRKLYFESRSWWENWCELIFNMNLAEDPEGVYDEREAKKCRRALRKHLESPKSRFFSLAPWLQYPNSSYPTRWLHQMVYKSSRDTIGNEGSTYSLRPRHRKKRARKTNEFMAMRKRNYVERIFYTTPIDPNPEVQYPVHMCNKSLRSPRIILQPVNIQRAINNLPHHSEADLRIFQATKSVLECYFGQRSVVLEDPFDMRNVEGNMFRHNPEDAPGGRVMQVASEALRGQRHTVRSNSEEDFIIYIIAPHMFARGENFNWIYSDYLVGEKGTTPWVLSTFMLKEWGRNEDEIIRAITSGILYCALMQREGIDICESVNCALNNSDTVYDGCNHMIICPMCIRKLQLQGVLGPDVPAFHRRLHQVLSSEAFKRGCKKDIAELLKNEPSLGENMDS